MTEVDNLDWLKSLNAPTTPGILFYVKSFSSFTYVTSPYNMALPQGGGIFEWRMDLSPEYQINNSGTIVKPNPSGGYDGRGRYVRKYDGYLNINWFGATGNGSDDTAAFQAAIDFASLNARQTLGSQWQGGPQLKGSTIYVPNGSYRIDTLILKDGVSIIGESLSDTVLRNINTTTTEPLFKIEPGRVRINISNLHVDGMHSPRGCFFFDAVRKNEDGGLWSSTIKNINITNFKGNGIYLKGGGESYDRPFQFNIFENVSVQKDAAAVNSDASYALKMIGQIGQHTFLNCKFDGNRTGTVETKFSYAKNWNVLIENDGYPTSNVVTFLNCSFQQSDLGVRISYAESISFYNCWFEELGKAIEVHCIQNTETSKGINILNNRFANASGFGSLPVTTTIIGGTCINILNSHANIHNNVVVVSKPELILQDKYFITANSSTLGLNISGNTFRDFKLGRCLGITQTVMVEQDLIDLQYKIRCKYNKVVFVGESVNAIKFIESGINPLERIIIRATGGISFVATGNIFLSNKTTISLANGDIAEFIKIGSGTNSDTYQLVSVMRLATSI